MNFLKKALCVIMVTVLLFTVAPLSGLADKDLFGFNVSATDSDFSYNIENGGAVITGYNGDGGDVVIPDTLDGYPVTSIGDYAFRACTSLENITIPNGVTSIGNYAFYDCESLTSITIPDSVTSIGDDAFSNTAFYNDTDNWEDDVLYIGKYLIEAENNVTNCTIKEGTVLVAGFAFYGCTSLTDITIPDSVTSIGNWAFFRCTSLTSITIPDSVTSIGWSAFADCTSLESITIPDSVTSIGKNAFYDTAFYNDTDNWEDDVLYIGKYLIGAENNVTNCTIKEGTVLVADFVFFRCTSLTSITIPNGVTSIGTRAFEYCTNLESITIPDSVTSIGGWAFNECSSLSDVYYNGTEAEWNNISISEGNEYLLNATIHFAEEDDEETTEPTTTKPVVTKPTPTAPATTKPVTTKPTTTEKDKTETETVKVKKPAKVKINSAKSTKKKKAVITWAVVKNVNGYEVQYSTSKKFTKKTTKKVIIKKAKTKKTTLKKLKSGKKYFIRVRAYKTVNGKKTYGAWSKVKTVKVK